MKHSFWTGLFGVLTRNKKTNLHNLHQMVHSVCQLNSQPHLGSKALHLHRFQSYRITDGIKTDASQNLHARPVMTCQKSPLLSYTCGCPGYRHMPTHFWAGKEFLSDSCSDLFEEEGKSFQFIVFSHSSNYKASMTYKWSINWNMGSMSSNIYSVNPYLIK